MNCRKQYIIKGILAILPLWMGTVAWSKVKITSIDFKGTDDPSEIDIRADGPIAYEKQENAEDKQLILELQGASISKSNARKIDTSSFNSKVSLISPYQVENKPDTVRVVIQLRGQASADISTEGNTLKVKIPNEGLIRSSAAAPDQSSLAPAASPDQSSAVSTPESPESPVSSATSSTPVGDAGQKTNLDTFSDAQASQRFSGKPITLQVRDADVTDVLRMIGETSGFNMIIGDTVKGKLTLSLIDVPWDQALDVILHTLHLGAERKNNILRVVPYQSLLDEKLEEKKIADATAAKAPRVTRVFPISYASLNDLATTLSKFATSSAVTGTSTGTTTQSVPNSTEAAVVQSDNRTNSIIVRDIPDNVEKMKKLIEILDTQTPQVMIEAKIVEATEGFSKNLSGSLGTGGNSFVASFAGANPVDQLFGTPGVFANGSAVSTRSAGNDSPNGTFAVSPSVGFIPGVRSLNAVLSWGEAENQIKIISSPKTVVLNKESASIVQGTPVLVQGSTTVPGVGTVPNSNVLQANISLKVKPTVTNDGSVLLHLDVTKDVPIQLSGGNQGIGNRNITTDVLVESGTTLVIGGIYTMEVSHSSSGFPFLRKIPIIGALFGTEGDSTTRSELFIFVTPKILNVKEAGLSG